MNLAFRLAELSRPSPEALRRAPFRGRDTVLQTPGGTGGVPLAGWDPLTGAGQTNFLWNVEGHGWNDGAWYGRLESLALRLNDGLELRAGSGAASFTRASTTTRVNAAGATVAVAANAPAFDWVAGPNGTQRYCLRADQADALLTLPVERNLARRQGGLSVWWRPSVSGTGLLAAGGTDRVLWAQGAWRLWLAAGTTELRWRVPLNDGTTVTAVFDAAAWLIEDWHLVAVDWSRPAAAARLWTDGALRHTVAPVGRFAELATALGLGQGVTAGEPANGYLVDFRGWPVPFTATLMGTLYAVQA